MAKKVASVGMRFDERTRFALDMLCRKRHRSSAGVVADLINRAAKEEISPPIDELWAADPPTRFLNLVEKAPNLMDHTEELILATIKLDNHFWAPMKRDEVLEEGLSDFGRVLVGDGWSAYVNLFPLTICWDLLHEVAEGRMGIGEMQQEYGKRLFDEEQPATESFKQLTERFSKKWSKLGA
jgi:hypothetical protein